MIIMIFNPKEFKKGKKELKRNPEAEMSLKPDIFIF